MWKLKTTTLIVEESTAIRPERLGGWSCINQGTNIATIDGVVLAPGEGLSFFAQLPPDVFYTDAIKIECAAGAKVVFRLNFYTQSK